MVKDSQAKKNTETKNKYDQRSGKEKSLNNVINENQMARDYNYSPKINSFAHSTHNFSPRSENNLNFNYKNILEKKMNTNTPQNNKKYETENNVKFNHNR